MNITTKDRLTNGVCDRLIGLDDRPFVWLDEGDNKWCAWSSSVKNDNRTQVTIQQLKEILKPEKHTIDIKHVKDFISILGNIILDSPDSDLSKLKSDLENKVNRTQLDADIEALKEKYKDFKITVIVE